jgi:hypothetical protein
MRRAPQTFYGFPRHYCLQASILTHDPLLSSNPMAVKLKPDCIETKTDDIGSKLREIRTVYKEEMLSIQTHAENGFIFEMTLRFFS